MGQLETQERPAGIKEHEVGRRPSRHVRVISFQKHKIERKKFIGSHKICGESAIKF